MNGIALAAIEDELSDLPGAAVGIGAVRAAVGAARALAAHRPANVVVVGTAGAYAGGPEIGSVVVSRRLGFADSAAASGLAYLPRAPEPLPCPADLVAAAGVPAYDVLTVGAITTDPELAKTLGADWAVEHLESYAIALACHAAHVRCVAVLGITNVVGPNAHEEWVRNRAQAEAGARAVARRILAG